MDITIMLTVAAGAAYLLVSASGIITFLNWQRDRNGRGINLLLVTCLGSLALFFFILELRLFVEQDHGNMLGSALALIVGGTLLSILAGRGRRRGRS